MKIDWFSFELLIMDMCESAECKTAEDYIDLSQRIHESVENAIQVMCLDSGVEDYEPTY